MPGPREDEPMVNYLPDAAYGFPNDWQGVMTRAEAQATLKSTSGWVMAAGEVRNVIVEDAGAGMCRVRLESR